METPLTKIPKTNRTVAKVLSIIIKMLLFYIAIQEKIIMYLMIKLLGKESLNLKSKKTINKKYRKLKVDDMPIFEKV